jgi:hypothetical protein
MLYYVNIVKKIYFCNSIGELYKYKVIIIVLQ